MTEENNKLSTIWLNEVMRLSEHFKNFINPMLSSLSIKEKESIDKLAEKAKKLISDITKLYDEKKEVKNFTSYIDQHSEINKKLDKFYPRVH